MKNLVTIGLIASLIFSLSGCTNKLHEEQKTIISNMNEKAEILSSDDRDLIVSQKDKIKYCPEYTTIQKLEIIKEKELPKIYPVFNSDLSINTVIDKLSYKEVYRYGIKACKNNEDIVEVVKMAGFYLPINEDAFDNKSQQNMQ